MATQEEFQERRERWAQALESGEYAQVGGALRKPDGFCCLGVACDLYSKEASEPWSQGSLGYEFLGHTGGLPEPVRVWLGLNSDTGAWDRRGAWSKSLAGKNDAGATFSDIAAIIREAPEGLFNDPA